MRIVGLPSVFYRISRYRSAALSWRARERLEKVEVWERLRAAELVGEARANLYRWRRRLQEGGSEGLEERSCRPRRCRGPRWEVELVQAVQGLRERYGWGKEKLAVLLRQAGWGPSASTVGRILKRLKQRGVLREPPRRGVKRRQRRPARPYAVRKPKGYAAQAPGDLVQVDTLEVRPLPGVRFKQFTARDVVSRWVVDKLVGI